MAESGSIMGMVGAFIGIAIMLSIGIQILGNSVQDCTGLPDYQTPNSVLSVTVTNAGASYESNPAVAFSGGGGTGATAVTVLSGTTVSTVTVTHGGESYETAPTVTISGGGGANATGTAVIGVSSEGWAAACANSNSQSQTAYALLIIILIVIAAVAILYVIRML